MIHRVGISIDERDVQAIKSLQKQFHITNRSEFFRELVRRYEKLEKEFNDLRSCVAGYLDKPEKTGETLSVIKSTLKNQPMENW